MSAVPTPSLSASSSATQPEQLVEPPYALSLVPVPGVPANARSIGRRARSASLSPSIVSGLIGVSDLLCVLMPGIAVYLAYVGWHGETDQIYLSATAIAAFMTLAAFNVFGLFELETLCRLDVQVKKSLGIWVVVFLVLLALAFALKISGIFSRVWGFSWFFATAVLICTARAGCYFLLRGWAQSGRLTRTFVIVGAGEQARRLIAHLKQPQQPWNVVLGVFDDRLARTAPEVWGYPVLGTVNNLVDFVRQHRTDEVIITLPWCAEGRIREIVAKLDELPVNVRLGTDLIGFTYLQGRYRPLGGVPMLDVAFKPLAGWKAVIKALEDKILAALLLAAFAPFMLLIALAIKLDSKGPVLFRQTRYGFNNGPFFVFKFRTMQDNGFTEDNVPQAKRDDPRVTRVGRFLRKTSLDELPQLFNVLGGSMSLVGPRPHAVPHNEHYAQLIRGYFSRHRVKPGITGWAQVNGLRGETDTPEKMKGRVEHDIWYIEHWSLLRDLFILLKTAYVVWLQKTAY